MYRVSPLTYWVGGMADAMLYGRPISCSAAEMSVFDPPSGSTCGEYLATYLSVAPGTLENPQATANCQYCSLTSANQFLAGVNISWMDRWRDFGLIWVYVGFNVFGAVFLYWFFRVRKSSGKPKKSFNLHKKVEAFGEALRNSYKAKGRTNKGNVEVF